ncbi:fatty acid-binding protein DegV [Planomonospora sphaerica]|uniref:Fatty acid-binding protein DegV n=1 Tax=Planomonospora sphaerica TaxID=161355 RepID=A0A171CJC3_9ACTN|nr:DegV family protein [Planomonospora sphaerica]GAT66791.1 fatty acid-binding protein DegV [Planomonospora sphaerica]
MPPSVAVVTDSTAYLPREEAAGLGIVVVPLQVIVGGRAFDDGVRADGAEPGGGGRSGTEPPTGGGPGGTGTAGAGTVGAGDTETAAADAGTAGAGGAVPGGAGAGRRGTRGGGASGGETGRAFWERTPVTTSRPAPRRFTDAYAEAAAAGAEAVVSIHLSGKMSGTVEAARAGAADSPIPVEVVDSGSVAMGLGFPVLAAAEAAARGAARGDVAGAARRRMAETRSFFYLDTLEYLRRGGRIGAAATMLGSALMIKPLLHIADGVIAPLEKVRTASRAIARLEDLAVRAAADAGPVEVAVQHISSRPRAEALAARLPERLPGLVRVVVVEVGAVLGAHAGPGMLGVTVSPVSPVSA